LSTYSHSRLDIGIYKGGLDANGQRSGKGQVIWSDGSHYDGMFENGLRHGQGVFTTAEGNIYTGNWHTDYKHGVIEQVLHSKNLKYKEVTNCVWEKDRLASGPSMLSPFRIPNFTQNRRDYIDFYREIVEKL
jgi:hypothetical protein